MGNYLYRSSFVRRETPAGAVRNLVAVHRRQRGVVCTQLLDSHAKWTPAKSVLIPFAALAIVALQLVPLPQDWLAAISPRTSAILPLWSGKSGAVRLGQWDTLSLAPAETRLALATLVGYTLLFVTVVQRIQSVDDVKRFMRWLGYSAVCVAGFGIVQYFTANGKFFWFYEYPYADTLHDLKGGFTGRNHFAHFLVLGLANLIAVIMLSRNEHGQRSSSRAKPGQFSPAAGGVRDQRSTSTLVLLLAVSLVVFAILASLSRGGIIAMLAVIAVAGADLCPSQDINFDSCHCRCCLGCGYDVGAHLQRQLRRRRSTDGEPGVALGRKT